ncbi:DsbC family protein [Ideonella sp. YS5]|uniref:DsbC family protein n=1 Tax=Ideonella sp. YS5 TaxID=3453714 RepID=UPI003EE9649B
MPRKEISMKSDRPSTRWIQRCNRCVDLLISAAVLPAGSIAFAFVGSFAMQALAAEPAHQVAEATSAEAMARQLRAQYPTTRIDSVTPSPVPGLYEVVMGKNVAYVEPTGRYFVFGRVWDMQQRRDTTADRLGAIDKVDVSSLPREQALTWTRGTGRRVLHVLADPQCGYCRKLERTLAQLDDVTVHVYVLSILGPESRRIAAGVWCAPGREQAWRDWMVNGLQPPAAPAGCPTEGLDQVERAAKAMGVQATPTLFSADGRKRAGALPTQDLVAWLDASADAASGNVVTKTGLVPADANPVKVNP